MHNTPDGIRITSSSRLQQQHPTAATLSADWAYYSLCPFRGPSQVGGYVRADSRKPSNLGKDQNQSSNVGQQGDAGDGPAHAIHAHLAHLDECPSQLETEKRKRSGRRLEWNLWSTPRQRTESTHRRRPLRRVKVNSRLEWCRAAGGAGAGAARRL